MSTTVLIADDDPVSRQLLSTLLSKWDFQVTAVSNGSEALQLLRGEQAPRLAILDRMMPELDGLEVIKRLRALRPQPYTYVLMLTAKDRLGDIVQGLAAGADDCLTKPFHAEELKARLLVGKRILDLQYRLVSALEVADFRGTHDALTGVYNRAAIVEVLRREAVRSQRENISLAIVIADADNFKLLNDTYGHLVGDEALKLLALRMKSVLRSYDWLGRCGGEEFMVVAPNCRLQDGVAIAERIRSCIAADDFLIGGATFKATVSLGVVAGQGESADVNWLLTAADSALQSAKSQGGNRVESSLGTKAACASRS
jgi:diguanylate cyclase (GGDEF)-like protein